MNEEYRKVRGKHREFIELLSKVNNSCVFVAELCVSYWFLSDNFQILGYDPQIIHSPEIASGYLETRIHPDDLIVLETMQSKLLDFIQSLPIDERKDYKHIYECRVRNVESNYVRFIFQQQILELDKEGNPWLLFGLLDISPDTSSMEHIKLRVINYKTGKIVPFAIIEQENDIKLSKREKEILKLVSKGMLSKEISNKLFLSIHTVNKHRQNIMQKMNTNNVLEAIDYARKLGLLT
ncbi:MAG: helix-turn-helix transcriptional regulator [Dysgonamonadaceae bacterium]|jgi:DNA-binding CsgD family transcriptional regulator|nr:helix-turn-helix transcriptional regulator [Dysgonamonadaceae bacterium]